MVNSVITRVSYQEWNFKSDSSIVNFGHIKNGKPRQKYDDYMSCETCHDSRINSDRSKWVGVYFFCPMMFQGILKWVSMSFKKSSMGVWGKFQRCFKEEWSVWYLYLKKVWRVCQGSFKVFSRGVIKSVECVSRIFKKKIKKFSTFKNLVMKFSFAILLLHDTHCSYPSRKSAYYTRGLLANILCCRWLWWKSNLMTSWLWAAHTF